MLHAHRLSTKLVILAASSVPRARSLTSMEFGTKSASTDTSGICQRDCGLTEIGTLHPQLRLVESSSEIGSLFTLSINNCGGPGRLVANKAASQPRVDCDSTGIRLPFSDCDGHSRIEIEP